MSKYLITFLSLLFSLPIFAQSDYEYCTSPEYRQLDFWVGKWNVYNSEIILSATSEISLINDGCAIHESYKATSGYSGSSINYYELSNHRWVQYWIDNRGSYVNFSGYFNEESMIFNASGFEDIDGSYIRRMRIIFVSEDEVRQSSDRSYNRGDSWVPEYRLIYKRINI